MVRKPTKSGDPYKALAKNFGIKTIDDLFAEFKKLKLTTNSFLDWEQACIKIPVEETPCMKKFYGTPTNFLEEVFWIFNEYDKDIENEKHL